MEIKKIIVSFVCGAVLLSAQADNTKRNKRDRNGQSVTADQQGETEADRETTRKIRKMIVDDSTLSTNAKNVKIITRGGKVTLRGPVKSEDEKRKVGEHAVHVAGNANVTNELELAK